MKLDVRPLTQGPRVGDSIAVEVTLLDANNQPAKWDRSCTIDITVSGSSGQPVQKYIITIAPNQSAAQFTVAAVAQPTLLTMTAREEHDSLLPGGYSVLIRANNVKKKVVKPSAFPLGRPHKSSGFVTIAAQFKPRFILLAAAQTGSSPVPTTSESPGSSAPALFMMNSTGRGEILADGKDQARIQVFYVDPQGGSAVSDIKVLLTTTNGPLHPGPPIIIKKGDISAEAYWTSTSPGDASVSLASSTPQYPITGNQQLRVTFSPVIYGIGTESPNPLKLSLIDRVPVVAQFFDPKGRSIQTDKPRQITFTSSNPSLHVDPLSPIVQTNDSEATVMLTPTWSGTATLEFSTPGYDHQTLQVTVPMWSVLLLCLIGGVVGGIAARDALKRSVGWQIFVGILGAIVLVWMCVYAVLPKTDSLIAHNLVSVFVVGILGGYGGTRVLDFAGKQFGFFKDPDVPADAGGARDLKP